MQQREKEVEKTMAMLRQKRTLQDQMLEKKVKCDEARDQFLNEKSQVDDIVQGIINEDVTKMQKDSVKKHEAFQTMQDALADKESREMQRKEKEKRENEEYKKYLESLELREYEFKLQKKELEEAKYLISSKIQKLI